MYTAYRRRLQQSKVKEHFYHFDAICNVIAIIELLEHNHCCAMILDGNTITTSWFLKDIRITLASTCTRVIAHEPRIQTNNETFLIKQEWVVYI